MNTDLHIHSSFSSDSESAISDMVTKGVALGLRTMCFTEHLDYDFPDKKITFDLDIDVYYKQYQNLREQFNNRIELLFGIEIGLQPHLGKRYHDLLTSWPFDFVIGSSHLVDGMDPYVPSFFDGRKEDDCYERYFESIIENIEAFSKMDIYGHIDYIIRYGPNQNKYYSYNKYRELLDEILGLIVEKGIGLEINTSGFKYGLGQPHPHPDILKRYRQLGGEIITVGSDGHCPEHLAYGFLKVKDILTECGFRYYTIFRQRKADFIKL